MRETTSPLRTLRGLLLGKEENFEVALGSAPELGDAYQEMHPQGGELSLPNISRSE